jgi:8-oxo-dGTP pyrophosphatase MutT (NUDIX family)
MAARQLVLNLQCDEFFQVAAVGYRENDGELEFLLVRTGSGRWTFPKGHVEPGLGARASALREAAEEAGAYGAIEAVPFTCYRATKNSTRFGGPAEFMVYAYLLRITDQTAPKESRREPVWVTAGKAKSMLRLNRAEPYAAQIAGVLNTAVAMISGASEAVPTWRMPRFAAALYETS